MGGASEMLCLSFRSVPRVIAIIRSTMDIAAGTHPVILAELLGAGLLIVVRRAQGGEILERRKCLQNRTLLPTALGDWAAVIDHLRRLNLTILQAGFTKRMLR
jgi:hypothetical protein